MLIDGYWLKLMWAVLAGAWTIATVIRAILVHLSWPQERAWRIFSVIVHAAFAAFFFWQLQKTPPPEMKLADLVRNAVNLLFVMYTMLDSIRGVYGIVERRAQHIVRERGTS